MDFKPNSMNTVIATPYFDDMAQAKLKGWRATLPNKSYQTQVANALADLNAFGLRFDEGTYPTNPPRYGYRITFSYNGIPARIDCAALPIRDVTPTKKDRALAQAPYLLAQELVAAANAWVYKPGSVPLLPYLIGNGGQTITESLLQHGVLPDFQPAAYISAQTR